ncbi:MAG: SF1B family DNA helicase RecD2 [Filifactoraceae bacterium]
METYVGKIDTIFFRSEENGYTVGRFITDDNEELIFNGIFITVEENDYFELNGVMEVHPKFGLQLSVSSYSFPKLVTRESIISFLGSGVIQGVRTKTAKKIVDHFGLDTMDILERSPSRLEEISGIGSSTLKKIIESYNEKHEEKKVILGLGYYDITPNLAMKIFSTYGLNSINKLRENPYGLCRDVSGIGFKKADEIARKLGIDKTSMFRIEEGLIYVLAESLNKGHTYLPYEMLVSKSEEILEVSESYVATALYEQCIKGFLKLEDFQDERRIFLQGVYNCECTVASLLLEFINRESIKSNELSVETIVSNAEKFFDIKLASRQKDAVKLALNSNVMILTGGPGTGKTTVVRFIIECFKELGQKVAICAPTGRAAKRLSESSGLDAQTIHRLLEMSYADKDLELAFGRDEQNPIDADVIIVDECSMVDIYLMKALLKAVNKNSKIIFIGDSDQLPSVGAGNVLGDMIDSKIISTITLNEIFRQSQESDIVANAHRINNGKAIEIQNDSKDFFFMERYSVKESISLIEDLVYKRLPEYFGLSCMDIQVLSPAKKGEIGTINLNNRLQQVINPPKEFLEDMEYGEKTFRVNDKVMQIKNEYNRPFINNNTLKKGEGIFNGDIGYVDAIDKKNKQLYVSFEDGRRSQYTQPELDNLELAYAITVHKSQGCEFPVVVMPIISIPLGLQSRNILYTGITRAKKTIVIVGSKNMVDLMISRDVREKRYSGLRDRIIDLNKMWGC